MSKRKPNILFLLTDQHRTDAIGAYGAQVCKTPNIDKLASEGVTFDKAYTACPVCSPTRASILTGQYPHTHGMTINIENKACGIPEIPNDSGLLSARLREAGYQLGYAGKWHLGDERLPRHLGFHGDNFPGHGDGGFKFSEYKEYLALNGFEHAFIEGPFRSTQRHGTLSGPEESTVPYFLAENTISLLKQFASDCRGKPQPFFMWTNFWGPHAPYYAPKNYVDMYRNEDIPPWSNYDDPCVNKPRIHRDKVPVEAREKGWDFWRESLVHYYAFTTLIDAQIGRILTELDKLGLVDDTLVIFSADHGESLGMHGGMMDKAHSMYEETTHIPFIIRAPFMKSTEQGTREDAFISLVDFAPTCSEFAGLSVPSSMQGMSVLPLLESDSRKGWRDTLVAECHGLAGALFAQRMVRRGSEKYVYNCGDVDEYYDLANDPYELNNRIDDSDCAKKIREMREILLDWMDQTGDDIKYYLTNRMGCNVGGV